MRLLSNRSTWLVLFAVSLVCYAVAMVAAYAPLVGLFVFYPLWLSMLMAGGIGLIPGTSAYVSFVALFSLLMWLFTGFFVVKLPSLKASRNRVIAFLCTVFVLQTYASYYLYKYLLQLSLLAFV